MTDGVESLSFPAINGMDSIQHNMITPDVPLGSLDAELAVFRLRYPAYDNTALLDDLRVTEFSRIDATSQIYLDYTGGGLYGASQLRKHLQLLSENVFGNPHSENPTSRTMTELDERARASVLRYFNASPDEYVAIFTANASGALKLVGESYPFTSDSHYLLTYDNHNSVNGIREFARTKGATTSYLSMTPPDLRITQTDVTAALTLPTSQGNHLFAYPAQSNFSGVQHSLEWIAQAQAQGWDVLVDCAAFAPTNRLDLSQWHPDFVPLSFYKIFGYPTGIGCLIARRSTLKKLHRPWFSGGSIWAASVESERIFMADDEAAFEDGTINYLMLPAVEIGLDFIQSIGIDNIHARVAILTSWLLKKLPLLRHSNGNPLVHIYGPLDTSERGGTIALNFLDPNGHIIDERRIDANASKRNISLRTGCFCNPGAGELAFSVSKEAMVKNFEREERPPFDDFLASMGLQSGGAVRVSLGIATTFADVFHFLEFVETFRDVFPDETNLPARKHC